MTANEISCCRPNEYVFISLVIILVVVLDLCWTITRSDHSWFHKPHQNYYCSPPTNAKVSRLRLVSSAHSSCRRCFNPLAVADRLCCPLAIDGQRVDGILGDRNVYWRTNVTQSDGRLLKKRDTVNPARDGGKMSKKRELSAKSGKVGISDTVLEFSVAS